MYCCIVTLGGVPPKGKPMFTKIEESLSVYRQELSSYARYAEKVKENLARQTTEKETTRPNGIVSTRDYEKLVAWGHKLRGMILVLGLTKAEEIALDEECGVPAEGEL